MGRYDLKQEEENNETILKSNKIKEIINEINNNKTLKTTTYHAGNSYNVKDEDIFNAFKAINKKPHIKLGEI